MCVVCVSISAGASSVALSAGGLGLMVSARCSSQWQPGGDRVRGRLLGHAVVADHGVEAPPGVGVLSRVVGLQGCRDTSLVLVYESVWTGVVVGEGFVNHQEHDATKEGQGQEDQYGNLESFRDSIGDADGELLHLRHLQPLLLRLKLCAGLHHHFVWRCALQAAHVQRSDEGNILESVLHAHGFSAALVLKITPQLHHVFTGLMWSASADFPKDCTVLTVLRCRPWRLRGRVGELQVPGGCGGCCGEVRGAKQRFSA